MVAKESLTDGGGEENPGFKKWEGVMGESSEAEVTSETRADKLKKGAKIVVCGPPHSGKSIFTTALMSALDPNSYYAMAANPDGEGVWLQLGYNDEQVKELRRKGKFTDEFVQRVAEDVDNWDATPILLVDIGGQMTPENAKIVKGATHAIILAGSTEKNDENEKKNEFGAPVTGGPMAMPAIANWEEWCEKNGLEVVAKVHSNYVGSEDFVREGEEDGVLRGSVHHLERGSGADDREAILGVADKIREIAAENEENFKSEKNTLRNLLMDAPKIDELVPVKKRDPRTGELKSSINRETGKPIEKHQLGYKAETVRFIYGLSKEEIESVDNFSGRAPKWVYVALHERAADVGYPEKPIYSREMVVPKKLEINGGGEGVTWKREEIGMIDGHPVIRVSDESIGQSMKILKPEDLGEIKLPDIPEGAIVIFSSRGPNWFDASVADGYRDKAFAFAEFQPRDNVVNDKMSSVVCWSKDEGLLGDRIVYDGRDELKALGAEFLE